MIGLGWNPTRRDLSRSRTTGRLPVTNPANCLEALRQEREERGTPLCWRYKRDQKPGPPTGGAVQSRHSSPSNLATGEKGLRYSLKMRVRCICERLAFALADTIDNGVVDQPKA